MAKVRPAARQEPVVPGEVPWKRTDTSRTIRNTDGSYTAEVFDLPINYRDADGVWQPIDSTLVDSTRIGYAWRNRANSFEVHFRDRSEPNDAIALEIGSDTYTITPENLTRVPGSRQGSEVRYENVGPSTDISYRATATGFKETITLRGPNAPAAFDFLLQGPGGTTAGREADGSVAVKDRSGKVVFTFSAPWARESEPASVVSALVPGRTRASLAVAETLGGHRISLAVDEGWLREPGRRFPVTVDPTVGLLSDVYWVYQNGNPCNGGGCIASNDDWLYAATSDVARARSALKFNIEGAIPYYSTVSAATLSLWRYGCIQNSNGGESCSTHSENIDVHRLTQAWDPAVETWDVMNSSYSTTVEATLTRAASGDWTNLTNSFTVTNLVQAWVRQTYPNHGFFLKNRNDQSFGQGGPAWAASNHPTLAPPSLTVTYTANANATSAYPPAAPGGAATAVNIGSSSSDDATQPLLPRGPGRSLFRASDALMSIHSDGCTRSMRAATPPYLAWSSPVDLGCDNTMNVFMRTDDNGTLYTVGRDTLNRGQFKRWSRSGSSTTWTNDLTTVFETVLATPASVVRAGDRIWVAYSKILLGDTTPTLVLKFSDNDGSSFTGQANLVRANSAQLVAVGGSAGIVVHRFSDSRLSWRSSDNWASETVFDETLATTDPYQVVADDQDRMHLVYQTGGGVRYRMRNAAGVWSPTESSPGTVISSTDTQPSVSTDGTTLTLLTTSSSGSIVRRSWNGAWSAPTTLISAPDPGAFGHANVRGALPARLAAGGIVPYLWQDKDFCSPCVHSAHFDYLDSGAPGGSITQPSEGEVLVGTATIAVSVVEDVGAQRADFFVDRGGGLLGYLGSDSTPEDGFMNAWNTRAEDGNGRRLWLNGAYRIFAVVWDYKGNRGETPRPLIYIQDQDLGSRPYRPTMPVPIGAGLGAQVNLWNGNLSLTHALLSDPTVIGPLTITRSYNSLDTQNGTAGLGWNAGAELDADISFARLIDHSADTEYPQNVVELVETDGTPHYYMLATGGTYASFIDDFSVLVKNGGGTWTLTLADGGRQTFDAAGNPIEYRTAEHSVDQPSFSYAYTSGRLSSITDPVGRGVTFTYDANNRLWRVSSNQSSPARTWTFTYSATGELTDVQDPVNGGATTHFDYDPMSKRMTQARTPAGVRVQFGYDASSRVNEVRQLHTEGATTFTYVTSIEYPSASSTRVIRPKGNLAPCNSACRARYTTTFGIDARHRLSSVQITLPDNTSRTKSIGWNDQNLKSSESDFSGHVSMFTYDRTGNLLTERTPDPDGVALRPLRPLRIDTTSRIRVFRRCITTTRR